MEIVVFIVLLSMDYFYVIKAAMPDTQDLDNFSDILVQPDYTLPPVHFCTILAKQHIRTRGTLSVVGLAECARPIPSQRSLWMWDELPSWCPDFVGAVALAPNCSRGCDWCPDSVGAIAP